jgi:hypothetical protein
MRNEIILLSGKQGSGKTTLMEGLSDKAQSAGWKVEKLIFADTIYRIHDFALALLEERGIKRDIKKDGRLLQLLGTEWGRNTIENDIWVKALQGQIQNIINLENSSDRLFIVSDCRFRNEFDGVPGAFKVRLECDRDIRKERCSQWREDENHISETDLDKYSEEGKFDCYVNTESLTKCGSASIVWSDFNWRLESK